MQSEHKETEKEDKAETDPEFDYPKSSHFFLKHCLMNATSELRTFHKIFLSA
jgi:hypothetical protein